MTKWPRDRLMAELKRALNASLHEHADTIFSEIEARLLPDGWGLDYNWASMKLTIQRPPHMTISLCQPVGGYDRESCQEADVLLRDNSDPRWIPEKAWYLISTARNAVAHWHRGDHYTNCSLRIHPMWPPLVPITEAGNNRFCKTCQKAGATHPMQLIYPNWNK